MWMTPAIWRLLERPPRRFQLFRRVLTAKSTPQWMQEGTQQVAPMLSLVYLFIIMVVCCATVSRSPGFFGWLVMLTLFIFNSTIYGLMWSMSIAGQFAADRDLIDVLRVLPGGTASIIHAVWSGCVHRQDKFNARFGRHVAILRTIIVLLVFILLVTILDGRSHYTSAILPLFAYLAAGLTASFVDYIQSVVIGCLVGSLATHYTRTRFDGQIWAGISFISAQWSSYTIAALIGFIVLPPIIQALLGANVVANLVLIGLQLVIFVGLREALVIGLWRLLADRLSVNAAELELV